MQAESASTKTVSASSDQNKSDCKFDFGTDVSARFTCTAYLKNLIPLDDTYNFPETNVITFAPNSRSGWHVHGGMYVIGVGGVGLYNALPTVQKLAKGTTVRTKDALSICGGNVAKSEKEVRAWVRK